LSDATASAKRPAALPESVSEPLLPRDTKAWIVSGGLIGHEMNCRGVALALGLEAEVRRIAPRTMFAAFSPFGPIDPREASHRAGSPLAPPFPDILIASGRRAVPYVRHVKRASHGRTFTVFMQNPRTGPKAADVIWVAEHDGLRGENVIVTLTSPHIVRPTALAAARAAPDPRLARLPHPRVGMILGGNSVNHRFTSANVEALVSLVSMILRDGKGLMITPSRRTPPDMLAAITLAAAQAAPSATFIWDGRGDNPYVPILALADTLVVTGDSVNMVGEAVATGTPVYVYEPSGGHPKMTEFLDRLAAEGAIRRYAGSLDAFAYTPIDATTLIAGEIARRYALFRTRPAP
jgi:mitochondrial fission protein ELM1